ncbi:MAG: DNA primase, partial [Muribaculaceae bacterium]|nr:DNA primase [Muribaculaceae bacterium]
MISDDTIDKVREVDVADIVSPYVELGRKGSRLTGCCPFHNERTASFSVSETNNLWHCFGCHKGGDGISFIMEKENLAFEEAVEHIAKLKGIHVEYLDSHKAQEARKDSERKESLYKLLEVVNEFFCSRINDGSPQARQAMEYAAGRWGAEYVNEIGIGYAPKQSEEFLDFVDKYDLDRQGLTDLGLLVRNPKSDRLYPFFYDRVTIPIRNRSNRIIGFTARYMGDGKKVPKYINSKESEIYSKSASLFGINAARKAARENDCVTVVEGAPDVMRMQIIGLPNTVAPLGTALTSDHLEILHKITGAICFVPDTDEVKEPGKLPPGFKAVEMNGTRAMLDGFLVTVREIPPGFRNLSEEEIMARWPDPDNRPAPEECREMVKRDADSFITSAEMFWELEEKNFVVWLAEKKLPLAKSIASKMKTVAEIADLVILEKDFAQRDQLCRQLAKVDGKFSLWKKALEAARERAGKDRDRKSDSELDEETRPYGFIIRNNCYYSIGEDSEEKTMLSNFILEPLFHIIDNKDGTRIFKITNNRNQSRDIIFKQSELSSEQAFSTKIESAGSYIWLGKMDRLKKIRLYCFSSTKSALPVEKMGWIKKHGMYAFGNGVMTDDGQFHEVDRMGMVTVGEDNFFMPEMSYI